MNNKNISLLSTGSEILNGDVLDTNTRVFAQKLFSQGGQIIAMSTASDAKRDIAYHLNFLMSQSDAVIITGGLGPTSDDVTRDAVAEIVAAPLVFDESSWNHIVSRLTKFCVPVTENNKQQAYFPKNSNIIVNDKGSANGCYLYHQEKLLIMLPGPPVECMPMFDNVVMPLLSKQHFFSSQRLARLLAIGVSESDIAQKISHLNSDDVSNIAYCWQYPYLEIKVPLNKDTSPLLVKGIINILGRHLVSSKGLKAQALLEAELPLSVNVILDIPEHSINSIQKINSSQLQIGQGKQSNSNWLVNYSYRLPKSADALRTTHTILLYHQNSIRYQFEMEVAFREAEFNRFCDQFLLWQLTKVINVIKGAK